MSYDVQYDDFTVIKTFLILSIIVIIIIIFIVALIIVILSFNMFNLIIIICVHQNGWTPLILAVYHNKVDIVKILLDACANLETKNNVR